MEMKNITSTLVVAVVVALSVGVTAQDHSQHQQKQPETPASIEVPSDHAQHTAPKQQEAEIGLPGIPEFGPGDTGMRLEEFEDLAMKHNPTLAQAEASIRSAEGRRRQAGMWSNPVVGYSGEEIRGGALRGGQHGAFIEQILPISGRLGLSKSVAEKGVRIAEIAKNEQRVRVLTAVKVAYYRVLAAQELLKAERAFAELASAALQTSRRLQNVGQQDETEVLQAEVELEQARVAAAQQENRLQRAWQDLTVLTGQPDLPVAVVAGRLDQNLPSLDETELMQRIVAESPEVRSKDASLARAEAATARARREWVPDLQVRAGIQQNRELLEGTGRPVGAQGFAEVGVALPIFNRNQGGVQAASAEVERARQERERVKLELRQRAAEVIEQHRNARVTVDRYRENMIPRAKRSYELMLRRWGQMGASYPQVLLAQRTLFSLQTGYINALEQLWINSAALNGFMLTDGLRAPTEFSKTNE
jgi:cobalt-zinc-cadmium efflux system outer membrane protein